MFDAAPVHTPHPFDLHVGARVRVRRKLLGLSQEALADGIGLTFQQVQKYERGSNRISASKLYEIGIVLKTPMTWFCEGYGTAEASAQTADGTIASDEAAIHAFLITTEGLALAQAFPLIISSRQRNRLLGLVQAMAADPHDGDA